VSATPTVGTKSELYTLLKRCEFRIRFDESDLHDVTVKFCDESELMKAVKAARFIRLSLYR